jgi:hypothetical protein
MKTLSARSRELGMWAPHASTAVSLFKQPYRDGCSGRRKSYIEIGEIDIISTTTVTPQPELTSTFLKLVTAVAGRRKLGAVNPVAVLVMKPDELFEDRDSCVWKSALPQQLADVVKRRLQLQKADFEWTSRIGGGFGVGPGMAGARPKGKSQDWNHPSQELARRKRFGVHRCSFINGHQSSSICVKKRNYLGRDASPRRPRQDSKRSPDASARRPYLRC